MEAANNNNNGAQGGHDRLPPVPNEHIANNNVDEWTIRTTKTKKVRDEEQSVRATARQLALDRAFAVQSQVLETQAANISTEDPNKDDKLQKILQDQNALNEEYISKTDENTAQNFLFKSSVVQLDYRAAQIAAGAAEQQWSNSRRRGASAKAAPKAGPGSGAAADFNMLRTAFMGPMGPQVRSSAYRDSCT